MRAVQDVRHTELSLMVYMPFEGSTTDASLLLVEVSTPQVTAHQNLNSMLSQNADMLFPPLLT